MDQQLKFPKNFLFGVATSSFQIEGDREGRGESIWDTYCAVPGNILDGSNGDIACDHVNKYKEDIDNIAKIGFNAYRLSISWPRLFPDESMKPSDKGVEFYNNVINYCLSKGITVFITLFHWDMPTWVYKQGGWLNKNTAKLFGEYARFVVKTYGDRVKFFTTFNEPQSFLPSGHRTGRHAPGLKLNDKDYFICVHNYLLAHGEAVKAMREERSDLQIGITMSTDADFPLTDSKEDIEAAKKSILSFKEEEYWQMSLRFWCDPIFLGEYPVELKERFGADAPIMSEENKKLISQKLDFISQNCYSASAIQSDGNGGFKVAKREPGGMKNSLGWSVTPRAIWFVTKVLYERYKLPIYITENGICCNDWVCEDGYVHDSYRVDFFEKYLKNLNRAIKEGVDIRGYFAWSLLDNFEWNKGYSARFGIIYVNYLTQQRILKDSAYFFQKLITFNKNGEK